MFYVLFYGGMAITLITLWGDEESIKKANWFLVAPFPFAPRFATQVKLSESSDKFLKITKLLVLSRSYLSVIPSLHYTKL